MSDPGSIAAELLNRLRLRYPRRITVQLGDLDAVFEAVGTVHGKKQRLQALGHYYEAFTAATGNTVTEAYTSCLAYWQAKRERVLGHALATPADVEMDLQAELRKFIVQGSVIPPRGSEVRVRLPGALTFDATADLGGGGNADGTALPSARFTSEGTMWTGNAALGKIPITARVEKRIGDVWVPAPEEWVHFQLIAPFHDSAAHELDDVNALRATTSRPTIPSWGIVGGATEAYGPKQFITAALNNSFDAADPQRYNTHQNRGGKRGLALLGNVFDALPAAGFPGMRTPEASPAPRTHAVRVKTNANGDTGVLFLPARMGGDRYRMRIFVDPNGGFASEGTEADAAVFETGRFCVWKHVLWSNYLPKPAPTFPALNSVSGVQARLAVLGYDCGKVDGIDGPRTQGAVRACETALAVHPVDGRWANANLQARLDARVNEYITGNGVKYVRGLGPTVAPYQFAAADAQFLQMYCELEKEPAITAAAPPASLTSARYVDAIRWAIAQAQANQATYGLTTVRNVSAMFSDEYETPFLFDVTHPNQYNRTRGAGTPAAAAALNFQSYWVDAALIMYQDGGLIQLLLRYINGGASAASPPTANLTRYSTPGLTVVSAIAASRLFAPPAEPGQVQIGIGNFAGSQASGIATRERGCTVFGGVNYYAVWMYTGDGYTCNALHEMGHTLYLRHQFTGNQVGGVLNWMHAGASFREDHDSLSTIVNPAAAPSAVPYDRCLMGYLACEGTFCGKCHLKIRGWDISQMPV